MRGQWRLSLLHATCSIQARHFLFCSLFVVNDVVCILFCIVLALLLVVKVGGCCWWLLLVVFFCFVRQSRHSQHAKAKENQEEKTNNGKTFSVLVQTCS